VINRFLLFRNIGQFDSVDAASNVPLSLITLIYAENGRGKTTLTAILRSLASADPLPIIERRRLTATHPPHAVIDCIGGPPPAMFQANAWNRALPNIVVFDDTFINENVYSGLAVEAEQRQNLHEFILGAQGIALNRTLQQHIERVEEHNRKLRRKADAIPATVRGVMNVDDFCALPETADIDAAIQAAERNLAAAQEQEAIRTTPSFDVLSLPEFDADSITSLLQRDLSSLDAAALAQVQRHLTSLGEGGEGWVADGMRRVRPTDQGAETCPFCAQDLRGSPIINHYRAYFSAAYTDLTKAIVDGLTAINRFHAGGAPAAFERAVRVCSERRQFWSRFAELPEVSLDTAEISRAWNTARDAVIDALQTKQAAPLEQQSLSTETGAAIAAFDDQRRQVAALNQQLQDANAVIAIVKEQAATGNRAALTADVARLKAIQARHTPQIAPLCADYSAEKTAKATAEQRRNEARVQLEQYRQRVFPAYENAINIYLRRFNAGFRIGTVTAVNTRSGSSCTYNVVINDQPVPITGAAPLVGAPSFRNTLSSGDRNTLALAFFFASLDNDPALADRIVVIDDPITSLDEHRSLTTVQEMRHLAERTAQVIVLSHDKPFLCRVWDGTDRDQRAALEIARDGLGSTIRAWDVNQDSVTEHDRRHALLREYRTGAGSNNRQVAASLRPMIEQFLRVAYPEHFPPGTLLGPFRNLCEQRIGTSAEILDQADTRELCNLVEYANRFHHDTNPAWEIERVNDTELLDFVNRTYYFTRRRN
jgi:wobble nucleotide-excising tRNase